MLERLYELLGACDSHDVEYHMVGDELQIIVQDFDGFDDFGNAGDDDYEPDRQEQEEENQQHNEDNAKRPAKKTPWDLVDPFDDSFNQVIPHARGNIFLNKKEVQKKLVKFQDMSVSYQQSTSLRQRSDLFYNYPVDEFFGFK